MTAAFLLTSFLVVVTPGTGVLYTVSAGLTEGRRASLLAAIGCTLGIVPHMLAAIVGLAAVLVAGSLAFDILRYAGVVYLLVLAWQTLRERGGLTAERTTARSARRIVAQAILVNLLNPKLTVFFFAFLPQFVPAGTTDAMTLLLQASAVFMAMTLAVFAVYGVLAAAVREHVLARPSVMTWLRRAFALAFVGLGARLAFAER